MDYSISYIVLYDVLDTTRFDMKLFLEEKMKMFDSVEEAYEDINEFVHKYNYLMNYINKSQMYDIYKKVKDCESYLTVKENEYFVVGETINKEFRIVIKKIHTS